MWQWMRQGLGRLISERVNDAIGTRQAQRSMPRSQFTWISRPLHGRIDIADKDAIYKILDGN